MVLKRETVIANVELILQTWNKHGIPLQDINHILSRRLKDNSLSDIFDFFFISCCKEKLDLSNTYLLMSTLLIFSDYIQNSRLNLSNQLFSMFSKRKN